MTHNNKSSKDDALSGTMKLKDAQWTLFAIKYPHTYSHFFNFEVWEYRDWSNILCGMQQRCESSDHGLQSDLQFDDRRCYSGPKLLAVMLLSSFELVGCWLISISILHIGVVKLWTIDRSFVLGSYFFYICWCVIIVLNWYSPRVQPLNISHRPWLG